LGLKNQPQSVTGKPAEKKKRNTRDPKWKKFRVPGNQLGKMGPRDR